MRTTNRARNNLCNSANLFPIPKERCASSTLSSHLIWWRSFRIAAKLALDRKLVYLSIMHTLLLYGCETEPMTVEVVRKLHSCLRYILPILCERNRVSHDCICHFHEECCHKTSPCHLLHTPQKSKYTSLIFWSRQKDEGPFKTWIDTVRGNFKSGFIYFDKLYRENIFTVYRQWSEPMQQVWALLEENLPHWL